MKHILLFLTIVFATKVYGQGLTSFDDISYDEVIAYEFQGDGGLGIEKCLKEQKDKVSRQKELKKDQIKYLEELIISNESYGNATAFCFDPHLGIIYYKDGNVVFSIDICLSCNSLEVSNEIAAIKYKMIYVSEDYSYPAKGFSKEMRKSIHEFCSEIEFTKYLKPLQSIYDK